MNDAPGGFRYRAFISYSHRDSGWSRWLHRALETYRVPRALVGRQTPLGPVPQRLAPVFRDREELASAHDLGGRVLEALAQSQALIVVCSPQAAASRWVNEEILAFQALGRSERIFCLIVDGEPRSGDARECFPPALRGLPGAAFEPIAADARPQTDGRANAKLKLIAGLLGLNLDALRQREARRRQRQLLAITSASVAGMLLTLSLSLMAFRAQREAERQQAQAEGLIEFMIGDLRQKLEPLGRLEVMDVVGKRAIAYYAEQPLGSLDEASIGRRSRALNLIGEMDAQRGDFGAALQAFSEASRATAELVARNPDSFQAIFDHAQSVFWIGYVAFEDGRLDEAETAFRQYLAAAERLVAARPDDPVALQELLYGHSNMGTLLQARGDTENRLLHQTRRLEISQALFARSRDDPERKLAVAVALNDVGTTLKELGRLDQAEAQFREQLGLLDELLTKDPRNQQLRFEQLAPLGWLASTLADRGDLAAALEALREGVAIAEGLVALDGQNATWMEYAASLQAQLAETELRAGHRQAAQEPLDRLSALLTALSQRQDQVAWQDLAARRNLIEAELAFQDQRMPEARAKIETAIQGLIRPDGKLAPNRYRQRFAQAHYLFGLVEAESGAQTAAQNHWQAAQQALEAIGAGRTAADEELLGLLLLAQGRESQAREMAGQLRARGYEPIRLSASLPSPIQPVVYHGI